ncbi:uncharacterized protein EAF02_011383 [Botrytis sinoallii]|uniref:uncharacterized protein n=1 Tax=Botrytis sinoallii TaxID=1463999 RepID=UPI001900FF02|nr:uncharacterized protein EAF02_011383 [Botrytis sinoallii]KAF7857150.1 hypothetical protein EAF02_011383 [Botrytis sinoallii]
MLLDDSYSPTPTLQLLLSNSNSTTQLNNSYLRRIFIRTLLPAKQEPCQHKEVQQRMNINELTGTSEHRYPQLGVSLKLMASMYVIDVPPG